jgi:3-oxoacyl-(acyl-carrier-protein) synthase
MILPESAASVVAIEFGLRGLNMAVTSACATAPTPSGGRGDDPPGVAM